MPRDRTTLDAMREQVQKELPSLFARQKLRVDNPGDIDIAISHAERAWCWGWFDHWTYDVGLDDQAYLDSFQDHVDAVMLEDRRAGREPGYALMNAEDRWRWHGRDGDGSPDAKQVAAPCRCTNCKKYGVVRILH
jgi:hypothetical protein